MLYGVSAGSVLSAYCTYPAEYEAYPEYAGREVHYDIKVDSVKRLEAPNYTDDFARAYLNAESIEDYENKLRAKLQKDYDKNYYNYILSQVWNTVYTDTVVKEYPEHEIDTLCDDMIESNKAYAASSGVQFSTYLGVYYEMTEEEFYKYVREEAETRVKQEMICYAIARAENIEITDEVYTERATVYAVEDYGYKTLAEFESVYSKETIYHSILCDLVFELIVENADITITENTFG